MVFWEYIILVSKEIKRWNVKITKIQVTTNSQETGWYNGRVGNTCRRLGTNRELVGCFIFDHWGGIAPYKTSKQNISIAQNFSLIIEADGYAGT